MKIIVRNSAGVERAEIVGDGLLMLAGQNAQGKSSLLRAVAAAATGNALPIPGMTRGGAGAFVRVGATSGSCTVQLDGAEGTVTWPDCQVHTSGRHPMASPVAAGTVDLCTMDARERARVLAAYIRGLPTRDDLATALADIGIKEPARLEGEADDAYGKRNPVERVWGKIVAEGWDAGHAHAKTTGVDLKGRFEQLTRARWGSDKGGKWRPEGWTDEMEAGLIADNFIAVLTERAKEAGTAIETAAAYQAVSAETISRLEAQVGTLEQAQADAGAAAKAILVAVEVESETAKARDALIAPTKEPDVLACPHCSKEIEVKRTLDGFEIAKAGKGKRMTAQEKKKAEDEVRNADQAVANAAADVRAKRNAENAALVKVQMAVEAKKQLDEIRAKQSANPTPVTLDQARAASASAERDVANFKIAVEALTIHRALIRNQEIVGILAADGLRRVVMGRQLEAFNERSLKPLSETAGWKPVAIDAEMALTYGGRSFAFLSESEKYRVRAILATACAISDGSVMLVLDGVDILDPVGRRGLVKMLSTSGRHVVLGCTYGDRALVPDMAKLGLGSSWWIEGGIVSPASAPAA